MDFDDEEEEDAFVFVYDRRSSKSLERQKIFIGGVFTYNEFLEKVIEVFQIDSDEELLIATTGRNKICDDDSFISLIENGDTLYLLQTIDQPLDVPVSERIDFQPHYDTLIKSGMYEYYASEGHINPLPFAFAELIDNALAATVNNQGERCIELSLHFNEATGQHVLCVYDNGQGMTSRQLNNWAIYRLSKFNRTERDTPSYQAPTSSANRSGTTNQDATPRSLNSDISWFGVGGKQAIFFIGNATRVITKPRGSCDVHEFSMSKDDFKRKERKKEAIFAGYIRNRKIGDCSHISSEEQVTRAMIDNEGESSSFTRVIVTGIDPNHLEFMRIGFDVWTRQLAHIYHYYIHGPEGNTVMSRQRKNVGALDVQIKVSLYEFEELTKSVNLGHVEDDLESRFIRSSADSFEFVVEGEARVEGVLRYHPFLYDKETYPTQVNTSTDDADMYNEGEPPGRGRRPIFECYWNGRLIPYTFVDDFEWCRVSKRQPNVPLECFYRISGCLFTNDKFQVSTNKLTFIDLETKLVRERSASMHRMILGEIQRSPPINRSFIDWLRECHEKYDKQVKFLKFSSSVQRGDGSRRGQCPWTVYKAIEWGGRTFAKGQLVRTHRTVPIVCGTIRRFLLAGDYDGEVYAVGGEVEITQEPIALYGSVRTYPLSKLDRSMSVEAVRDMIYEEEGKLPSQISVTWPEGDQVSDGQSSKSQISIGAMKAEILNRNGESVDKLPATGGGSKKLLMEQKLMFAAPGEEEASEVMSHVAVHGKSWPFLFKRIDEVKDVGFYELRLQVAFADSGEYKFPDGKPLPTFALHFTIAQSPPYKFVVGILESPLRVGEAFDIPLNLQNKQDNATMPTGRFNPILKSDGLRLSFDGTEVKGNSLIITNVVAIGNVTSQQGKSFQMTVCLPGLERDSQTLKVRLLPGKPQALRLVSFNGGSTKIDIDRDEPPSVLKLENGSNVVFEVEAVDAAGNLTSQPKLVVNCKISGGNVNVPTLSSDLSHSGRGTLAGKIRLKKVNKPQNLKAKIEVHGVKQIRPLDVKLQVQPSTKIRFIEISHQESESKLTKLRKGQELYWEAGETMTGLTFQLFDEAKRLVQINQKLASMIKVNWTAKVTSQTYEESKLPDIIVPTNVTDTKFCQVTFAGEKNVEFTFNLNPVAGEPAGLRITHSIKEARLGVVVKEPICVSLLDNYGNRLNVRPSQLDSIRLSGEGLDDSLLTKSLDANQIIISRLQFNQGPLGTRGMTVQYGSDVTEYFVVQLGAGTPVTVTVSGWACADGESLAVLSGSRLGDQITVQLLDGWGNPSRESGVKILLGRDPALRMAPTPAVLKTGADGTVTFPRFSFTGKCGEYFIQPRAVYERTTIEGPKLAVSVLPNTERPVAIRYECDVTAHPCVVAGRHWPDFRVEIRSEEGGHVTSPVHICMALWRGKPTRDTSVPNHSEWHRAHTHDGRFTFSSIASPVIAGQYTALFCVVPSKTSKDATVVSESISLETTPGEPRQLQPDTDPGTPTVSNAKHLINRTLIRSLRLQLKDEHGNVTPVDDDSRLEITIQPCDTSLKSNQVPLFEGNSSTLNVRLHHGEAHLQNLVLQENSPGTDGSPYVLHCELMTSSTGTSGAVPPYMLKFLFYNDARKHVEMAGLMKQRDALKHAVQTYEKTFQPHNLLFDELKRSCHEFGAKKHKIAAQLDIPLSSATCDVTKLIEETTKRRSQILERPRRRCTLKEYEPKGKEIIGKVGQLALIDDEKVARVLSWHLAGDMDCLVTTTAKKAREVHKLTKGLQQLLPLENVRVKKDETWAKSLPRVDKPKNVQGNPVYARTLLTFPNEEDKCRKVFKMLLGDTLIMDDLESANEYRKMVVKHANCPTILTLDGERVRSSGKFGGKQNKCPTLEQLRGCVFGQPIPKDYVECCTRLESLKELLGLLGEETCAREELTNLQQMDDDEEMNKQKLEYEEAQEKLRGIEAKIASDRSRPRAPPRVDESEDGVDGKPKRKRRK